MLVLAVLLSISTFINTEALDCSPFLQALAESYAKRDHPNPSAAQVRAVANSIILSHTHGSSCFFVTALKRKASAMSRSDHSKRCQDAGGRLAWLNHEWGWDAAVLDKLVNVAADTQEDIPGHFKLHPSKVPMLFIGLHRGASKKSVCEGWMWTNEDGSQKQSINVKDGGNDCFFFGQAFDDQRAKVKMRINVEAVNTSEESYPSLVINSYCVKGNSVHLKLPHFEVHPHSEQFWSGECDAICEFVSASSEQTIVDLGTSREKEEVCFLGLPPVTQPTVYKNSTKKHTTTVALNTSTETSAFVFIIVATVGCCLLMIAISVIQCLWYDNTKTNVLPNERELGDNDAQSLTAQADVPVSDSGINTTTEAAGSPVPVVEEAGKNDGQNSPEPGPSNETSPGDSEKSSSKKSRKSSKKRKKSSKKRKKSSKKRKKSSKRSSKKSSKRSSKRSSKKKKSKKGQPADNKNDFPSFHIPEGYEVTDVEPGDGTGSLDNVPAITNMEFKSG